MKYSEKKVFISGTSTGLGHELATYFLGEGAAVIGCSRTSPTINNSNYSHYSVDVSNAEQIKDMFRDIKRTFKNISILINNAGVGSSNLTILEQPETLESVINTNILGPLLLSREAIRIMRKGDNPRIINIGSILSVIKPKGGVVYATSKSALHTQTACLAKELANLSITCNLIGLNVFESNMSKNLRDAFVEEVLSSQSIKRFSKIEDIINVIDFFCSPKSNLITGQAVFLGGIS